MFRARNAQREHLLLWGPMGVGKSSVGVALGSALERPFLDLDRCIETSAQQAVAQIFSKEGEAGFRQRERATLDQLLAASAPSVIALGGGTLVDLSLCDRALRAATVIGLSADTPTLLHRLAADPTGRPLLDQRFAELLRARADAYGAYHWLVSARADVDSIARRIADRVRTGVVPITIGPRSGYAVAVSSHGAQAASHAVAEALDARSVSSVFVITDSNVASLHAERFAEELAALGIRVAATLPFPAGEAHKTLDTVRVILRRLTLAGADRSSVLVGLGGGVVTDITGFVASIFLRGVRWLAVPTTTMGMSDAATGGKTGVDLDFGKNLVGAIHHPVAVIVDSRWNVTETDRAVRSGMAEAVKIAAVADAELFQWMEQNVALLRTRDEEALSTIMSRSASLKARFVEADPNELHGYRILLNFGHTLGHALESAALAYSAELTREPELLHGEAVAVGMVMACELGRRLGVTGASSQRVSQLLASLGLPVTIGEELRVRAAGLVAADKKRVGVMVRFVFLEEIGRARLHEISLDEVRGFLTATGSNPC